MDAVGEGENGANGAGSISIYTLACVKWIVDEKLPCNPGSPLWCSVMTQRVGWGEGRGAQEGGAMCIIMAD